LGKRESARERNAESPVTDAERVELRLPILSVKCVSLDYSNWQALNNFRDDDDDDDGDDDEHSTHNTLLFFH